MSMTQSIRGVLLTAIVTVTLGALAAPALADETQWQKDHPRRTEVNKRLANQNKRIHNEVKEGEITKAQAKQLHGEDHAIRQEERTMASTNGGHITKAEQKALNQQENQVSQQIGK
jgi:gas vesicle protein